VSEKKMKMILLDCNQRREVIDTTALNVGKVIQLNGISLQIMDLAANLSSGCQQGIWQALSKEYGNHLKALDTEEERFQKLHELAHHVSNYATTPTPPPPPAEDEQDDKVPPSLKRIKLAVPQQEPPPFEEEPLPPQYHTLPGRYLNGRPRQIFSEAIDEKIGGRGLYKVRIEGYCDLINQVSAYRKIDASVVAFLRILLPDEMKDYYVLYYTYPYGSKTRYTLSVLYVPTGEKCVAYDKLRKWVQSHR
jgi:hypothetical protein